MSLLNLDLPDVELDCLYLALKENHADIIKALVKDQHSSLKYNAKNAFESLYKALEESFNQRYPR